MHMINQSVGFVPILFYKNTDKSRAVAAADVQAALTRLVTTETATQGEKAAFKEVENDLQINFSKKNLSRRN